MKFKRILSLFMMGVMFSANIPFNVFAEEVTNDTTITEDELVSGSALNISDSDIDFEFNITGQWEGGFNGEIKITNLTDAVIENWQIQMEFPQEITNIWNAAIDSHEGTVYNIRNAGNNNNENIPVGESITFGFSGTYEDSITSPSSVKLVQARADVNKEAYTIEYSLLSDWGSGYSAQITITNNTDKPFEAWHLSFDFDRNIDSIWNAVIEEHTDNKYYISNADYNSVIPANSSISFGFNGSLGSFEIEPKNYQLIAVSTINKEDSNDTIANSDYYSTTIGYAIGDYEDCVTQDLSLPTEGAVNGSTIIWTSSNSSLVSNEGKVTRPLNNSEYVILTATFISKNGEICSKDYTVKVIKKFVPKELDDISLSDLKALNGGTLPYIYVDEGDQYPRWISGKYSDYIVESPEEAIYSLNALKTMCGFENPQEEYVIYNTIKDDDAIVYRLQQVYKGMPVEGMQLVVGTDLNGHILYLIGKHYNVNINGTFKSDEDEIINILKIDSNKISINKIVCCKEGEFIFAWKVEDDNSTYIIDDETQDIISQYTNTINGEYAEGTTTINDTNYPENPGFNPTLIPVKMQFTREIKKNGIKVGRDGAENIQYAIFDSKSGNNYNVNISKVNYGSYYTYELYDDINKIMCIRKNDNSKKYFTTYDPEDSFNPNDMTTLKFNKDATDLFLNARKSLDSFRRFGRKEYLNIIGDDTLYIALNDEPINGGGLAGWNNNRKYIGFYAQDKAYNKLEVCGHEMTHAILHTDICLLYDGTISAIHEGYADIMGCIINRDWNFANTRNIESPSSKFCTSLNSVPKTGTFPYDSYNMSTIISNAAYNMYNGKMYGDKKVNIDYEQLGELWYKSIKNIASTLNYLDGNYRNYYTTPGALTGNMHAVGIGVYQAAQNMDTLKDDQRKLIIDCFADAGIYLNVSVAGTVTANVSKINKASITVSTKNNSVMNATSKTTFSNSNGDYFINIGNIGDTCLLNCSYGDYDQFSKEIFLNDMINEENIELGKEAINKVSISGYILSALDEQALENIGVYIYRPNTNGLMTYAPIAVKYTDKNGYFNISDLQSGTYIIKCIDERNLKFESKRCASFTASLGIVDDVEVTISLGNAYPIYSFQITYGSDDSDRTPIGDAKVSWFKLYDSNDEYLWYETITDENGVYTIALADGKYNIYLDGEYIGYQEVEGGLLA